MKTTFLLLLTCLSISLCLNAQNPNVKGTFTDPRDNKTYKTVKIGEQTWMAENLAYEIPSKQITDETTWANNSAYDGWCYYDNNKTAYANKYGILYQWEAAKNACPSGWHLPNEEEWTELTDYLTNNGYGYEGSGNDIGKSMAATSGWTTNDTAGNVGNDQASNDSSGFNAYPGGCRYPSGTFDGIGDYGSWWRSQEFSTVYIEGRYLHYAHSHVFQEDSLKAVGRSVRCVKNF